MSGITPFTAFANFAFSSNGGVVVGLATSADASLSAAEKGIVFVPSDFGDDGVVDKEAQRTTMAIESVYLTADSKTYSHANREHVVELAALAAIVAFGWIDIRRVSGTFVAKDGDFIITSTPSGLSDQVKNDWTAAINAVDISVVLIAIIATKVTWINMNHHVGAFGPIASGYAGKVQKLLGASLFSGIDPIDQVSLMHRIGHFASTRIVIALMLRNITDGAYPVRIEDDKTMKIVTIPSGNILYHTPIEIASDLVIRVLSAPAGTHAINVVRTGLKMLATHSVFAAVPNRTGLLTIVNSWPKTLYLNFHPGASYLGIPYDDATAANSQAKANCGSVGSFLKSFLPNSSLVKSPVFATYQSAEDYSPDFEALCTSLRVAAIDIKSAGAVFAKRTVALELSNNELSMITDLTSREVADTAAANVKAVATSLASAGLLKHEST